MKIIKFIFKWLFILVLSPLVLVSITLKYTIKVFIEAEQDVRNIPIKLIRYKQKRSKYANQK